MDQEPSPSTLRERKTTTIVAESDPKALIRNPPIRRPTNATNGDLESQAPVQPGFRGWLSALLHPNKAKERNTPPLRECLMNIVKYSYLNILLLLIPVSWIMHFTHQQDTLIFVFSFLSIIPLAALLGFATEELALRVGPTLGGLLNATFGNAVELIIAIIALKQDQLKIVQASMLGSFLSNCLLVLGMCFFAGGLRFHEQAYGTRIAQQQISLLSLSVFSVVVPAAFVQSGASTVSISDVTAISRGTAIVLLICYAAYLVFQLYTHKYLYTLEASKLYALDVYQTAGSQEIRPDEGRGVFHMPSMFTHSHSSHEQVASTQENGRPSEGDRTTNHNLTADGNLPKEGQADKKIDDPEGATKALEEAKEEEEEELPQLKVWLALVLLVFVTVITGVTAEFLVSSIDGMTTKSHVNKEFVALILLPLVGNAAEHVTAVTVSVKNKLDLAMGVAIGSSIQIFLFVLPFMVVLAWGMDKPLTLAFDVFETVVVALAIIVVSYAIADGRTNWLEGFVLMVLYVIIAIATWFHKADGLDG